MAEIVSAIVVKLTERTIDPILCQFKYMFCYNSKIKTLTKKMEDLQNKEHDLQQLKVKAERNAEAIIPGVTVLLDEAAELKKQAEEFLTSATATNSEMQCLFLTCPNLKTRYSLGREATKKTALVAELLDKFTYKRAGEPKPVVQTPYQNPGDFGAFETRISIKKKIMEALKDKDVRIIGICGMAGVGKTTMAKKIAKEVDDDNLFDEVAMAVVSQDPDVTKIQDDLAEELGLTSLKEKSNENVRARLLRERLGSDASKSVLVILDDVWECIELGNIGIPLAGDDQRLKVLLTSRFEHVCNDMGAQKKFKVDVLNPEESWELFKKKAEIYDNATDATKCMAEKVARECGGLPLALVTVGRALSRKTEDVWKNALEELQNSSVTNIRGVQKSLYSSILLSYNYLESDEAKSLLLLCSLFPEDFRIAIEVLFKYAWGLKLFRGTDTLSATRCRVNTIVDDLKSCYLLLPSDYEGHAKLHDVVRDVCLQIASKEKHAYMSKHTGLKEWPAHDNNESYSAISLTSTELNQLPSGLEYPNLKFLLVVCQQQSLDVSRDFFINMKELRVLDFTSMRIQIPSSIQLLTNLQTLGLYSCTLNIEISTIGNLKKLEVLSFYGSDLDHFPDDIAALGNLRSLDLRLKHSSSYCPLPPGILLQLKKLEELYMGVVEIRDGELEQRGYCIIKEISSLTGLNTFQISTHDPHFLLKILHVLCIEKLERFHIELTDIEHTDIEHTHLTGYERYCFKRRLDLDTHGITDASALSQHAINSLMWRADHLPLRLLERNNMSDEDGFEYLNGNHPTGAFNRLQEIYLRGIPRMKHLWRGVIKPPSLHNLMILKMRDCPSVKSLFSESVALCMVNLQSISISNCEMLEEIVSMDTEQNEVTQMLEFPKLQEINLYRLRNFKSFRSGSNKLVGVHNPLFNEVTLPNLEKLNIVELGCTILFDFENTKDDAENSIPSQLSLPKLVHITRMFPTGNRIFENLTELKLFRCDNLSYLFSPSVASSLVALNYLSVSYCGVEEIIGRQEEGGASNIEIVEDGTTSRIVFPKLTNLALIHLDRFRLLSSRNYELVFPSLKTLRIEECPVMTKFCSRQSAPMLDKVKINFEQSVDISNFMDSEGSIHM